MSSPTRRARSDAASTRDLALVAAFAALIVVFGLFVGPRVGPNVPIVLQNFAIMLAGCVLGARRGVLATLVFFALALVGLPILPGGVNGLTSIASPRVGYFLSYPLVAGLVGYLAQRRAPRPPAWWLVVASLAGGVVLCHAAGVVGLMIRLHSSLGHALALDAVFLPLDVVKAVVAGFVAAAVHRSVPGLLARR